MLTNKTYDVLKWIALVVLPAAATFYTALAPTGKELIMLTNKTYDVLKWIALVVLPAAATFYTALAPIWGLPYESEIPMTITAVDALLGALLGVSSVKYQDKNDGDVLKWIALVVLPAAATFYTALAPIWGLPYESEIPMTITAVDALLGALLGVSSVKYQDKNDGAVD